MKTTKVEAFICYTDHTWDTKMIELEGDLDTVDVEKVESIARKAVLEEVEDSVGDVLGIAFVGIYNFPVVD